MASTSRPRSRESLYAALRAPGIRRAADGRWIAGVAAGVARRYAIDPVIVRVAFVVLGVIVGVGVGLYLLAWALLPGPEDDIPLRSALEEHDAGAIVLCVVAAIAVLAPFGDRGGWSRTAVGLLLIGGLAWWFGSGRAGHPGPSVTAEPETPRDVTGSTRPAAAPVGAPTFDRASGTWRSTPPPGPTAAPRTVTRRPGGWADTLLIGGAALLAFAGGWAAADATGHDPYAVGLAATLLVAGACLTLLGALGRRHGLVLTMCLLLLVGALTGRRADIAFSSATWTPTSVEHLQQRYALSFGSGVLDLTHLPPSATPHTVAVDASFGDVTVIVPAGRAVNVEPDVAFGDLKVKDPGGAPRSIGSGFVSDAPSVIGDGAPTLTLNVDVSFGSLTIERR